MKKIILILLFLLMATLLVRESFTQSVKEEYPNTINLVDKGDTELVEKRTEKGKIYSLDGKGYKGEFSMAPVHYKDSKGSWQNIDLTRKISDNPAFDYLVDEVPYKLYISDTGARRIYPDRNKPQYIDLPAPHFLNGEKGSWNDNRLEWTNPDWDALMILRKDGVKFLAVIKKSVPFNSFSFPVEENGAKLLDYLGNLKYWDSSDPMDPVTRNLDIIYEGGVLTLGFDLTGMVFPVYVDPQFNVGASEDDVSWLPGLSTFDVTPIYVRTGQNPPGSSIFRDGLRFINIPIAQGSTINSAYFTLTANLTRSETGVLSNIWMEDTDNATRITSGADYDSRATTTNFIAWDIDATWTAGSDYNSLSIVSAVQEVVDRFGWASGNAMNILWKDNGSPANTLRAGASWDDVTYTEPRFTITWTESANAIFFGTNF